MKITTRHTVLLICTFLLCLTSSLNAQTIRQYCLEVSAKTRTYTADSSIIDFKWPYRTPTPTTQYVNRKLKEVNTWDTIYRFLSNTDSTFSDTILTGNSFEYEFTKDAGPDGYYIFGFIHAGHMVPAITNRGKILLIIDSTNKTFLDTSIRTFRNDLIGDGWQTEVKWFSPSTTVAQIKTYIVTKWTSDSLNVKSVVLIGDLAVPYSGDFNASGDYPPDGHTTAAPPSHEGAWPADCYYGDINSSSWTDATVTNNLGARAANNNNPGDGKFDQTYLPNLISLQVGRIDLSGMTSFSKSERELLKQYFTKNHNFRHKIVAIKERCLIDDNFGIIAGSPFNEAFGNNAYRNMAPLINDTCTKALDYLTNLGTNDYLWSFGLGNGGYTSCTGVGNSAGFAAQSVKSVFTGLFGSYFVDWDNGDNILRAPLASSGNVLNSFWMGRPHWFFHHMAMGETIGYSTLVTQNNYDPVINNLLYPTFAYSQLQIHVALMGDPTVRMQPVEPAKQFTVTQDSCSTRFRLKWQAPSDTAVHSYYLYRAKHIDSSFSLLAITPSTQFVDSTPISGNNVYMIRSLKLQLSGSGTYYNLGQGVFDTINTVDYYQPIAKAGRDTSICKNQYLRIGTVNSNSIHTTYQWLPASFPRDTTTIKAISSGNRILLAIDTISKCIQKDTMVLTVLALPVNETMSVTPFNACGDTATWSSSVNNGNGYNYAWVFEHGTPDTSGYMLNIPGKVAYDTSGNFAAYLQVTDTLTQCKNSDTLLFNVNCLQALPIADFYFDCDNNQKGLTIIEFINRSENSFKRYEIEGLNEASQWIKLFSIDHQNQQMNSFSISSSSYQIVRLSGVKFDGKTTVLDICKNHSLDESSIIHPIPVENILTINSNSFLHNSITYKLYDCIGQMVIVPVIEENNNRIILDTSTLPIGNYLILIMIDDQLKQVKFNKI